MESWHFFCHISAQSPVEKCQDVTVLINNAGVGFNQRFLTADLAGVAD